MKSQGCWRMATQITYAQKSVKGNTTQKGAHKYFPMLSCPRQVFQQTPSSIQAMSGGKILLAVEVVFT